MRHPAASLASWFAYFLVPRREGLPYRLECGRHRTKRALLIDEHLNLDMERRVLLVREVLPASLFHEDPAVGQRPNLVELRHRRRRLTYRRHSASASSSFPACVDERAGDPLHHLDGGPELLTGLGRGGHQSRIQSARIGAPFSHQLQTSPHRGVEDATSASSSAGRSPASSRRAAPWSSPEVIGSALPLPIHPTPQAIARLNG